MKRLLFIPLLLFVAFVHAQSSSPVKQLPDHPNRPNHCVKKNNYGPERRMTFYPFNIARQIQLISFEGVVTISEQKQFQIYSADPQMLEDTVKPLFIKEQVSLTATQLDQLTDLLFNYGCTGDHKVMGCYTPHNAITFADAEGHAQAFIEICFHCSNSRESDTKFVMEPLCSDKLALIKKLFQEAGIKYGLAEITEP